MTLQLPVTPIRGAHPSDVTIHPLAQSGEVPLAADLSCGGPKRRRGHTLANTAIPMRGGDVRGTFRLVVTAHTITTQIFNIVDITL